MEIALDTPDDQVRADATAIAANLGTAEVRRRLWTIAVDPALRWVRVDAINGLAAAGVVEPAILAEIAQALLLNQPPVVAVAALALLCRHGSLEVAVSTAEQVAQANKTRAMLLVAAVALAERGEVGAARHILRLLPDRHPAARLLDLRSGKALRSNALDDLGNVRVREAVVGWLGPRLAKPAKVKYRPRRRFGSAPTVAGGRTGRDAA